MGKLFTGVLTDETGGIAQIKDKHLIYSENWFGSMVIGDYILPIIDGKIQRLLKIIDIRDTNDNNKEYIFSQVKEYKSLNRNTLVRSKYFKPNLTIFNSSFKPQIPRWNELEFNDGYEINIEKLEFDNSERNIYITKDLSLITDKKDGDLFIVVDNKENGYQIQGTYTNYMNKLEESNWMSDTNETIKKYGYARALEISPQGKRSSKRKILTEVISKLDSDGYYKCPATGKLSDFYDGAMCVNESKNKNSAQTLEPVTKKKYWIFAPGENAGMWESFYEDGIMAIDVDALGDLTKYSSKEEIRDALINYYDQYTNEGKHSNSTLAIFEFAQEMKIGDIVYVKKGRKNLVGRGIIESDYYFDDTSESYKSRRKVKWTHNEVIDYSGKIGLMMPTKTLTDMTKYDGYPEKLENLFGLETRLVNLGDTLTGGYNRIYYGVPGCGKSYYIKNNVLGHVKDEQKMRVTFHSEYSYNDFIGQIMPKKDENGITYIFKPGPFTKILDKAINDKTKEYHLVIEELNRGNAPAIFGDIFQLLDRDKNGESEYDIYNEDIAIAVKLKADERVKIPSNLFIHATINTSDQNVFTLDTAFKRRWEFKMVDETKCIYDDKGSIDGFEGVTWKAFRDTINNTLACSKSIVNGEDKQLGPYFAREHEVFDKIKFANKVLMYLWEDAFKFGRTEIFNPELKTFGSVLKEVDKNGFINVFKSDLFNMDGNNEETESND